MNGLVIFKAEHPDLWEQVGSAFQKRRLSEYGEGVYDGHLQSIATVAGLTPADVHREAAKDFGGGCR